MLSSCGKTGFLVLTAGFFLAAPASADECNIQLAVENLSGDPFGIIGGPGVGSEYTTQVRIGTELIDPPGTVMVERFRFALDCQNFALIDFCTDDGDVVRWLGNEVVVSGCGGGTTVTCNGVDAAAGPNVVTCQFNQPVVIPPNVAPVDGCIVNFDLRAQGRGSDATPDNVQEGAGFSSIPLGPSFDANCFNAAGPPAITQPVTLNLCQDCDDGDACTLDTCDATTNTCSNVFDDTLPGCLDPPAIPTLPPWAAGIFVGSLLGTLYAMRRRHSSSLQ